MQNCPDCGAGADQGQLYCYECGAYLQDGDAETRSDDRETASVRWEIDDTGEQQSTDRRSDPRRERDGRREQQRDDQPYRKQRPSDEGQSYQQRGRPGENQSYQQRGQATGAQPDQQRGRPGENQSYQQRGQVRGGQPHARQGRPGESGGVGHRESGRRIEDGKLSYALGLPFEDGLGPVTIGSLLATFSFLLVPLVGVFGYVYDLTEAAANGKTEQPEFHLDGDLLGRGTLYTVVAVLGAGFLFGVPYAAAVTGAATGLELPGLVAALGLFTVGSYLLPAVMTLYPVTGSVSAALSPGRIAEFAFTSDYLVSYVLYVGMYLTVGFAASFAAGIAAVFLFITIVGILLIPFLYAGAAVYWLYFSSAFWGATYYEAVQDGTVDPPAQFQSDQSTGWD